MITRKEKYGLRRCLRADIAKVLFHIAKKHVYSQQIVDVKQDNPLFEDSCSYVALYSDIMEFARTLVANNQYEEIILKEDEQ